MLCGMRHAVPVIAALVALLPALTAPPDAGAWSADKVGDTVSVFSDPGESNQMTADLLVRPAEFFDAAATYRQSSPNCRPTPAGGAECGTNITHILVALGDQDDSFVMRGSAQEFGLLSSIDPGGGEDDVLAGSGSEVIRARDGERDTIACGSDTDTVFADDQDDVAADCEIVLRPTPAPPVTATVTTTADEDDGVCDASCSLREAARVVQRTGAGTIVLPRGTFDIDGGLWLYRDVAIRGAGARETVVRNPGPGSALLVRPAPGGYAAAAAKVSDLTVAGECSMWCGVLAVANGATLSAERAAVVGDRGAKPPGTWSEGVGVSLDNATLMLRDSTVTGNTGGGLYSVGGSLTVVNTTISANTETSGRPIVRVSRSQFVNSTLDGPGTALDGFFGEVSLRGTIVAGPCDGDVRSYGGNVLDATCAPAAGDVTADPQLGPLGDHGGPTDTRVPAAESPAIDLDVACSDFSGAAVSADQRGVARPIGAACDSGAVEAGGASRPGSESRDIQRPSILSVVPSRRRGTRMALRSLSLAISLSEPARVHVALRRRPRARVLRAMTARLPAGRSRLAVGRRLLRAPLRPRLYAITLTAVDAAGNRSAMRAIRIRLEHR